MRPRPLPLSCCWIFPWLLLGAGAAFAQQPRSSAFPDSQLWEFGLWGAEGVGKRGGQDFGTALMTLAGFHASRVVYEYAPAGAGKRTLEYTIELEPLFLVTHRNGPMAAASLPLA
jgi:hypothetical protein